MIKKKTIKNIGFILFCMLISIQMMAQTSKVFVGYIDKYPVFNAFKEKKVYILKDTIVELFDYPKIYSLRIIKNDFRLYIEDRTEKDINIILCNNNEEKRYSLDNVGDAFVALSEDGTIFFTDRQTSIKYIVNEEIKDTKLKGYCLDIVGDFLYYSQEHHNIDSDDYGPNMDIFKVDKETLQNSYKLIENVAGEMTVIVLEGKYIYDDKLMDGVFKPVIYDVEKGIYQYISVDKELTGKPFYSFQEDALIFYNSKTMEFKKVNIYNGW